MSTYRQCLYQIVFATKHRGLELSKDGRQELFRYAWGVMKKKGCHLYRINGVEDHLHIAMDLHQSLALADFVKDLKLSCSNYIKAKSLFKKFSGWQDGYGAFTYSIKDKDALINYIKNQEEHHKIVRFEDEYRSLLSENGVRFDERYLF